MSPTVGIDLAKKVFQLQGVYELGKPVIKKQIRRNQMEEFFVNLLACLIGMEACGGVHHWARKRFRDGGLTEIVRKHGSLHPSDEG